MQITKDLYETKLTQYRRDREQHARMVDVLDGAIQDTTFWLTQLDLPEPDQGSGQLPPPPPVADNVVPFPAKSDAPTSA